MRFLRFHSYLIGKSTKRQGTTLIVPIKSPRMKLALALRVIDSRNPSEGPLDAALFLCAS